MPQFDIIIKDGMIFDGARSPRFKSDLGVRDGKIVAMGHLRASDAARVIDAAGLHVAPGFIDLHTHYDAQVYWDPYLTISSWHGSTSVVIGNCGFGFAPVKPEMRERAMLTLTRNEAIPLETMAAAMPWDWVTFPEYLDSVDRTPKAINLLPYVGLSPLLIWTMGLERAKAGELPTDAEHAEMRRILNEAMDAGACGWSVQRLNPTINFQRDYDGLPMPTDMMHDETALILAGLLAERNDGFIQCTIAVNLDNPLLDRQHVEKLAEISRRPIIWNALTTMGGMHRDVIAWLESMRERGLRVNAQASTTEVPMYFTFEDWNQFDDSEAWYAATSGTVAEKLAKFKDPAIRDWIRRKPTTAAPVGSIDDLVMLKGYGPETKQYENLMVKDICALTGKDAVDVIMDLCVADEMRTLFYFEPFRGARSHHREVVEYPWALPGVSDGGAHVKFLTGGRYPTEYLSKWVRDMAWLEPEEAHWRLSAYPAFAAGFRDRGVIREGAAADIVVYDYEHLAVLDPEIAYDLPANEWRRIQRARGYRYILVNGQITIEDDKETGVYSGQLLRFGAGRPTASVLA
jgi:N-acyl-D-aspartate/D-glutamate deacylase